MKASELMQAMLDAGAPMEAILIALRAIEGCQSEIDARDADIAEKKAKDAARKRAERDAARTVQGLSKDAARTVQAAPLSPSPNENNSNPHPHAPETQTHGRARADDFPMPDFCQSEQTWRDFKTNRRAKRLPCTPSAHAKLIRDVHAMADEDWPPGRLFEEIVARGWAAAHDPRTDRTPANDRPRQANSNRNAADIARSRLGLRPDH